MKIAPHLVTEALRALGTGADLRRHVTTERWYDPNRRCSFTDAEVRRLLNHGVVRFADNFGNRLVLTPSYATAGGQR